MRAKNVRWCEGLTLPARTLLACDWTAYVPPSVPVNRTGCFRHHETHKSSGQDRILFWYPPVGPVQTTLSRGGRGQIRSSHASQLLGPKRTIVGQIAHQARGHSVRNLPTMLFLGTSSTACMLVTDRYCHLGREIRPEHAYPLPIQSVSHISRCLLPLPS